MKSKVLQKEIVNEGKVTVSKILSTLSFVLLSPRPGFRSSYS